MARKRFSDEDVIRLLRQIEVETASGASVAEACRSAGVSDATYYGWRKKFGGMGPSKVRRIYNELGLQLRNKTPKRRVKAKLREGRKPSEYPHETWAMDFVHDQLAVGTNLRILTVIDTFSRFVPIVDPRLSYKGEDVVNSLELVCHKHGYPKSIRVDNGPEFISKNLDLWAYQNDVILDFSRPGKPTE